MCSEDTMSAYRHLFFLDGTLIGSTFFVYARQVFRLFVVAENAVARDRPRSFIRRTDKFYINFAVFDESFSCS